MTRLNRRRSAILSIALLVMAGSTDFAFGESGLELVSGFDEVRLKACYPIEDSKAVEETARLIYRLRKADPKTLESRAADFSSEENSSPGEIVSIRGTIVKVRQYTVSEELAEYLDLKVFHEILLESTSRKTQRLIAPPISGKIAVGDRIEAVAMLLNGGEPAVFVAGDVQWFSQSPQSDGWRLLGESGVSASELARAGSRNRRPLSAADGEIFYSMMRASQTVAQRDKLPAPISVDPIKLLGAPQEYQGEWIRIEGSTVRVTKVAVEESNRRDQLGQDHYYQIDASGDLSGTVIELKRPPGEEGEPIRMSGKYPISLVSLTLPPFLKDRYEQNQSVVMMLSHPVSIDGFFYRLWSYRNEFMDAEGGGRQLGPLIFAARWRSMETPQEDSDADLALLGYALALAVVGTILATFLWNRTNAKGDTAAKGEKGETIEINL